MSDNQSGTEPVVRIDGLSKRYGNVAALCELDLDVLQGEFLTLLGPSGCGKTTTLRVIGGFERPDSGRVYLGGADVTDVPPYFRPVNTVFQSYALFPHISAFDNVAFGLRMSRIAKSEVNQRVMEQLEMVGLAGAAKRKPHQLSGGEQQRIALARALVLKPRVLLLDEPLGSLDYKLRKHMEMEMKAIQRQAGITFILVTHDQTEAITMSDRIAVMNRGTVDQVGSPLEVYERPRTRFVAGFLGDANFITGRILHRNGKAVTVEAHKLGQITGVPVDQAVLDSAEQVVIAVRPEHVTCHKGRTPAESNALFGRVEDISYVGAMDRKLTVRLSDGSLFEALVRSDAALDLSVGDEVTISWHEERTAVLGDGES
jgi:spermidine/putrescine ABC transporter ATP-binding subunit